MTLVMAYLICQDWRLATAQMHDRLSSMATMKWLKVSRPRIGNLMLIAVTEAFSVACGGAVAGDTARQGAGGTTSALGGGSGVFGIGSSLPSGGASTTSSSDGRSGSTLAGSPADAGRTASASGANSVDLGGGQAKGGDGSGGATYGGEGGFAGTTNAQSGTQSILAGGGGVSGASGNGAVSAGSGGKSCVPGDDPICDDQNSCTLDSITETCICAHQSLADGTTCDDKNLCTADDVCGNGICVGTVRASTVAAVGTLRSFGQAPGLQTLVAFPDENRAVFARSRRLTLVGLDGDEVKVLDDVAMDPVISADSVGSGVWATRPRTFLIPVLEHQLAIASANRGIDLYDLAGDKIVSSGNYGFGVGGSWPIVAATGGGSRLFVCTSYEVQTWSINRASATPISSIAKLAMPTGRRCVGLSVSPDGTRLYMGTTSGLQRIDVSATDGSLAFGSFAREGNLVVDVQANAKYVAEYEIRDTTSGYGDVNVLLADSLEKVTSFTADLTAARDLPIGFSLLDGDRILLQFAQPDAMGCYLTSAVTFAIGAVPTELKRRTMFDACTSPFRSPSFHTVAHGRYAVVEPMHQLTRIDAESGAIAPLLSPQQGSFESLHADGPNTILAYGWGSVHRVDVKDPTKPQLIGGGPASPLELEWLRLDVTNPTAPWFATVSDPSWGSLFGPVTTLLRVDASGLPSVAGSIANDDENAPWAASANAIFQLSATGTADFRLRRFSTSTLTRLSYQSLTPDLEQTLSTSVPSNLGGRTRPQFSIDAKTNDIAILEPRADLTDSSSAVAILSAFAYKSPGFERRFSRTLEPGFATSILTAAGRSVLLIAYHLVAVDHDGNPRSVSFSDNSGIAIEALLSLDERKVILAASWNVPSQTVGVLVLNAQDFSEIVRYPTDERVTSVAEVGDYLAFGSKSTIYLAPKTCSMR